MQSPEVGLLSFLLGRGMGRGMGGSIWSEDQAVIEDTFLHDVDLRSCLSLTIFPSTPTELKTKVGRKRGTEYTNSKSSPGQRWVFPPTFLLFLLTNKNAIIINPNKDLACCYVLNVVWPGGQFTSRPATETPLARFGTASLLTQRNKGGMIHDQQHAKVKQENGTK